MVPVSLKTVAVLLLVIGCVYSDIPADEITNLPGLANKPPYRMYSGYLNATGTKKLHYWFVESAGSFSDPVVLWLNGGPGCSSMDGILSENGPFKIQDDGKTLKENPYSWNKIAHVLYLEAPAGVGYSYSDDRKYSTDDDKVSLDNYMALKMFFKHFHEYSHNEFFITGESYGGIYVPTLSERIVDDLSFNFKGMAIGNGLTDRAMLDNSLIYFGYYHGLFGTDLWSQLVSFCCVENNSSNCNFHDNKNYRCHLAVSRASEVIGSLNIYNLYQECYGGVVHSQLQIGRKIKPPPVLFMTKLFMENQFMKEQRRKYESFAASEVDLSPPCINSTAMTTYMNSPNVREALHIPHFLPAWTVCSAEVSLGYRTLYTTVREQYLKVLASGDHRILVYNGDVDMACNFLGDEWFVDSLGQPVLSARQPWFYFNERRNKQIAGFVKQFRHLTYLTIKGSGHMVPQDKPVPAYIMFEHFIKNQPY